MKQFVNIRKAILKKSIKLCSFLFGRYEPNLNAPNKFITDLRLNLIKICPVISEMKYADGRTTKPPHFTNITRMVSDKHRHNNGSVTNQHAFDMMMRGDTFLSCQCDAVLRLHECASYTTTEQC
jgi:hypothetical protein